jgi:uncharacterized protein YbaP (TraB family)
MKKGIVIALFFLALMQSWAKQNMAWEISYFDDKKVYLVGSIHAGTPEMYPLSNEIMTAFQESGKIAVEANQEAEIDGNLLQKEMQKAYYREGVLQDSISADLYDKLLIRLQSLELNPTLYERTKPWYLSMVLQSKQVEKAGLQLQYGIDHFFIQEAKKLEKPILEVEGVLRQLKFLSDLPDSTQHLLLNYTLMEFETYEKETQKLAEIWMNGDTKELEDLVLKTYLEYEDMKPLFHAWIVERNYDMAETIIQYIHSEETVFVVVGAAHVVGHDGILQILRRKGYFIRRL